MYWKIWLIVYIYILPYNSCPVSGILFFHVSELLSDKDCRILLRVKLISLNKFFILLCLILKTLLIQVSVCCQYFRFEIIVVSLETKGQTYDWFVHKYTGYLLITLDPRNPPQQAEHTLSKIHFPSFSNTNELSPWRHHLAWHWSGPITLQTEKVLNCDK